MFDDELGNLLRQADEGFTPELPAAGVTARRVQELDRRRRQRERRLAAGAVLAALLAAGIARWQWSGPRDAIRPDNLQVADVSPPTVDASDMTAYELNLLAQEADMHRRLARRMIAERDEEQATARRLHELAQPDPLDEVRLRLDIVAFRMVCEADRLQAAMEPVAEAVAIYRDVIRLFPTTTSASVARTRLATLRDS